MLEATNQARSLFARFRKPRSMTERLRKARRVLAVQLQLDRLAKWTLVDLNAQAVALEDRHHDLVRFMDSESAFSGLFATVMMRRLQAAAEAQAAMVKEIEMQSVRLREERGRLRRVERIVKALQLEARRKEELTRLAEAIDAALTRAT